MKVEDAERAYEIAVIENHVRLMLTQVVMEQNNVVFDPDNNPWHMELLQMEVLLRDARDPGFTGRVTNTQG